MNKRSIRVEPLPRKANELPLWLVIFIDDGIRVGQWPTDEKNRYFETLCFDWLIHGRRPK